MDASTQASRRIAGMFDSIAPSYDRLNRLLSMGLDQSWRRAAIRAGDPQPGQRWLDLAAGSGDMVFTAQRMVPGVDWVAADPSRELLQRLEAKCPRGVTVPTTLTRAEALPFPDASFDGATVAFGVRNFADTQAGLDQLARVIKPGGRLMIIEFHPVREGRWGRLPLVSFYLEKVIPVIGSLVSGQGQAYQYLAESSAGFWPVDRMAEGLREAGFRAVQYRPLFMDSVMLTRAVR